MARFLHILPAALVCALFFAGEGRSAEPYTPQHPDPVLEPWRWRIFAELKGAGLRALAEDGEGPLWFGLTKGVRGYDGLVWTDYTPEDGLVSAPVNVLAAGRDGTIYAGSDMGISQFRNGAWSRLFPPEGEVEDSGAGIAAEEMGTLFDAFVQTDSGRRTHEGSGLGLPISQQLVRMMGGEIEVESAVGQG